MQLLRDYVIDERDEIMENDIRLIAIGDVDRLPDFVKEPLDALMRESAGNRAMTLCLALSYGGRESIVAAARELARGSRAARSKPDEITEEHVSGALQTGGCRSWTCWSARRARSACRTSCSGRRPTPSSTSPTPTGPTSARRALPGAGVVPPPRAALRPHARADPQRRLSASAHVEPRAARAVGRGRAAAAGRARRVARAARVRRARARSSPALALIEYAAMMLAARRAAPARRRSWRGRRARGGALPARPSWRSSGCWRRSSAAATAVLLDPGEIAARRRAPGPRGLRRHLPGRPAGAAGAPAARRRRTGRLGLRPIAVTFGNDTGAYFAGRALGRHKLYPARSRRPRRSRARSAGSSARVGIMLAAARDARAQDDGRRLPAGRGPGRACSARSAIWSSR